MKNIEKKWMLFLIATFVTFFGIGYTLLKETFATTTIDNTAVNDTNDDEIGDDISIGDVDCEVTDLMFNEGTINFNPDVMEYTLNVSDFSNLSVIPVCGTLEAASYTVEKNVLDDNKTVVVTINASDESFKTYTINVTENVEQNDINVVEEDNNNYTLIFISIICILVLINIYRIVKNKRSK